MKNAACGGGLAVLLDVPVRLRLHWMEIARMRSAGASARLHQGAQSAAQ